MRLGWLEIVIIIIAIILILVVTRIVRVGRDITNTGGTSTKMSLEQTTGKPRKMTQRLRATGIIIIIIGIISLLAGVSFFKWAYWSFLWAFITIAIGFMMVFLSRKRY